MPLPNGMCSEATFVISDHNAMDNEPLGYIYKKWSSCYKLMFSSAAWYIIDFPEGIDWKKKLLIISGV